MSEVSERSVRTDGRVQDPETSAKRMPQHTLSDLLVPFSTAFDLAEGRAPGHAQRVAYIAVSIAEELALDGRTRLASCYAALAHDIGAIVIGASLAQVTRGDERLLLATLPLMTPEEVAVGASETPELVVERIVDHTIHGARAAQELLLPDEAVNAVSSHHENWDGNGYPYGLAGDEISIVSRIVTLADQVEALIGQSSPLSARRNLPFWLNRLSGRECDPDVASALRSLGAGDSFWLGLFGASLPREIAAHCALVKESKTFRLVSSAETLAKLVDSRFSFTMGISARVVSLVESLGRSLGLPETSVKQLRLAALLHDLGQLAVSERVMAKPGILSVDELESLRLHPAYSRDLVAGTNGLEEVSLWVAAHHERLDGRGYPDGLVGDEIPLGARILAIADAYVAMTSERPHRPRVDSREAARRLRAAAGEQLDPELVDVFLSEVVGKPHSDGSTRNPVADLIT